MDALRPPWPHPIADEPEPPSRRGTWGLRLAAIGAILGSIAIDRSIVFLLPVLFVLVVPFEKLFPRHPGQRLRRSHASLDMRYALTAALAGVASIGVGIAVALASLAWVPALAVRPLVAQVPGWAMPFVGIALFDLAIYWAHRWSHEVPALWRFHAIHHSTEQLDWVSGFRNHPFDGAIVAPPAVFLLVAGFDPAFTGVLAVVQFATGLFLHANVRWRWRSLQRIVITPEFHHWHHAYEPEAHNSNYSVFFPIWDIMFGTYYIPRNKRPVRYGVDLDIPTTMRGQLVFPFRDIEPTWAVLRHPVRGARVGAGCVRSILRDVWRSTTRPRARALRPGEPLAWTNVPPNARIQSTLEAVQQLELVDRLELSVPASQAPVHE